MNEGRNEGTALVGYLDAGKWSACFGLSLRDLFLYDATHHCRIVRQGGGEMRKMVGAMGIASGRNDIARAFLDDHDAGWLFFIDSDMGFGPDTVDRLIASADPAERPVMGGLCFAGLRRRTDAPHYAERLLIQPTVYEYVETGGQDGGQGGGEVGFRPIIGYPRGQVMQAAGTGAACLLIHRDALQQVRSAYGDAWFDPITHPTGLHGRPRTFSEDLSFCVRLAGVGIGLHVDTAVKTCHEKGGIFLDEFEFDRQQALAVIEEEAEREPAEQRPVGAAHAGR